MLVGFRVLGLVACFTYGLQGLGFRNEGFGVLGGASVRREHRIGGSFTKSVAYDSGSSMFVQELTGL